MASGAATLGALIFMGAGDQLIGSGLARDAWTKRGVKVALGDGNRVIWDKHSEQVFRNNPNIVYPGNEARSKVEWVAFYKGSRGYNRQGPGHWIWNMDWRCVPGEIYLSHGEEAAGRRHGKGFVVIEPNVVRWKSSSANKDWGVERYQALAERLLEDGKQVVQLFPRQDNGESLKLSGVKIVKTDTFRDAVAVLKNAAIYVGAEGGLHHAAAAVGVRGVVIFGGWIPPQVTGYDMHTNIASSDHFCGSFKPCEHCREALAAISVETVFSATKERLSRG